MIRLHIIAEGQTEESFVNRMIVDHLSNYGVFADVRCFETGRKRVGGSTRIFRGGISSYEKIRKDIDLWMRQDSNSDAYFTTMIDLYGLDNLRDDFPGYQDAGSQPNLYKRIELVEDAFQNDLEAKNFIPYLQLHEFEALLFSDLEKFGEEFIDHDRAIDNLKRIAEEFDSPEEIDEGIHTAPSKRIIGEIPEYEYAKVSAGPLIAEKIGLHKIRECCTHFDLWMTTLENLGGSQ